MCVCVCACVCVIAATVMTFSVLEGHSPIASLFKCNIFICGALHGPSASAELIVLSEHDRHTDSHIYKLRDAIYWNIPRTGNAGLV